MSENYQSWVERVVGGRDNKPLNPGDVIKSSAGQPFSAIEFVKLQKKGFTVEVGKKGNDYIYHFYPEEKYFGALVHDFFEPLKAAFLQAFQSPDQIEADWVEEMSSWAIKVRGFVDTVWGDDLAIRAIDLLEEKLRETEH